MAPKKAGDERHELDRESDHRFDWNGLSADTLMCAIATLTAEQLAVRVGSVGYGTAMRVTVTTVDGRVWGDTCVNGQELQRTLLALCKDDAAAYITDHAVDYQKGRKRR